MTYEAGLQALEPRNFSGPLWEELTGTNYNVVELSASRPVLEADRRAHRAIRRLRHPRHRAGLDPLAGRWRRDRADRRLCREIHEQGGSRRLPPAVQVLPTYKGKRWGFFDDGDMFALYYRTRHLRGPEAEGRLQGEIRQAICGCRRPGTTTTRSAQFITDQMAPNVYGAAHFRKAGSPGNQYQLPAAVPRQRRRVLRRRA